MPMTAIKLRGWYFNLYPTSGPMSRAERDWWLNLLMQDAFLPPAGPKHGEAHRLSRRRAKARGTERLGDLKACRPMSLPPRLTQVTRYGQSPLGGWFFAMPRPENSTMNRAQRDAWLALIMDCSFEPAAGPKVDRIAYREEEPAQDRPSGSATDAPVSDQGQRRTRREVVRDRDHRRAAAEISRRRGRGSEG